MHPGRPPARRSHPVLVALVALAPLAAEARVAVPAPASPCRIGAGATRSLPLARLAIEYTNVPAAPAREVVDLGAPADRQALLAFGPQVRDTLPVELLQLELVGVSQVLGDVTLRAGRLGCTGVPASTAFVTGVRTSCARDGEFSSSEARLDLELELEATDPSAPRLPFLARLRAPLAAGAVRNVATHGSLFRSAGSPSCVGVAGGTACLEMLVLDLAPRCCDLPRGTCVAVSGPGAEADCEAVGGEIHAKAGCDPAFGCVMTYGLTNPRTGDQ